MAKTKDKPELSLIIPEVFKIGDTEINRNTLITKRDEDVKLVVNGISDTAGYKQAIVLRASYRTTRTALEKYRKEISAPHQQFVKKLKEVTDELGEIAYQGELYFDQQITAIDQEKERIKQEAIMAEARRVQLRINELNKLGAQFDGEVYTFPYDVDLAIDTVGVKEATDDIWNHFLGDVQFAYNEEQERIENALLVQKQLEEEQENERRLVVLQAEANKTEQLNLLKKRTDLRVKELKLMQFEKWSSVNGDGYYSFTHEHWGRAISDVEIEQWSDNDWEVLISKAETEIMETRNVIAAKAMETIIDEEPVIASEISLGDHTEEPSILDSITNALDLCKENKGAFIKEETEILVKDWSLNEFELFAETLPSTNKHVVLKAINSFKAANE